MAGFVLKFSKKVALSVRGHTFDLAVWVWGLHANKRR